MSCPPCCSSQPLRGLLCSASVSPPGHHCWLFKEGNTDSSLEEIAPARGICAQMGLLGQPHRLRPWASPQHLRTVPAPSPARHREHSPEPSRADREQLTSTRAFGCQKHRGQPGQSVFLTHQRGGSAAFAGEGQPRHAVQPGPDTALLGSLLLLLARPRGTRATLGHLHFWAFPCPEVHALPGNRLILGKTFCVPAGLHPGPASGASGSRSVITDSSEVQGTRFPHP